MRGKKDATTFPDKPVSWIASLFPEEHRIKVNMCFFDVLLGDFSAILIVNWRDVRSLSFNLLQIKKVPAGPFALLLPLCAATNHDPFDLFDAKGFQLTDGVIPIN